MTDDSIVDNVMLRLNFCDLKILITRPVAP